VRSQGDAVDAEELHEGVICIAAPVRDHAGEVVTGISVSSLKARVREARMVKGAQDLVRTAAVVLAEMGDRAA